MKTTKNLMIRNQHQELVMDVPDGLSTIAFSNYELIRSADTPVSNLIIPYQMNENFIFRLFDRGAII